MSQHAPSQDPFTGEVRFKVPLPLLIPLVAVAVIAAVTIGIAWVLLNIPPEAATTVALAVSINVLIACAVVASRRRMEQTSLVEMAIIVLYPILIGVVIAQLGIGGGGHGAEAEGEGHAAPAAAAGSGPVEPGGTIVSHDFAFDPDQIALPAGEEAEITLDNQDSTPHNIYIYPDQGSADAADASQALFQGEDAAGNSSVTYSIDPLDAGEYPFICQLHPNMTGIVTVE